MSAESYYVHLQPKNKVEKSEGKGDASEGILPRHAGESSVESRRRPLEWDVGHRLFEECHGFVGWRNVTITGHWGNTLNITFFRNGPRKRGRYGNWDDSALQELWCNTSIHNVQCSEHMSYLSLDGWRWLRSKGKCLPNTPCFFC